MFVINSFVESLKKTLSFKGRATKWDFWIFVLFFVVYFLITGSLTYLFSLIHESVGIAFLILFGITWLALFISGISLAVRRLHDLELSGFWLWYLNPSGLPIIFMVYLLDLDNGSDRVIEKINKTGYPWLGWILATLFWPVGALSTLFLMCLYDGKKEDNEFGPNPYNK